MRFFSLWALHTQSRPVSLRSAREVNARSYSAGDEDINRLRNNVPLQEAGRISSRELTLSRANKSVRMFEHVKERLSQGQQPDLEQILSVGYLMRTTAVYGSGKFGAADREEWGDRDEFRGSFQPELLTVWLIRAFTIDLVEHLASANSPSTAVRLDPEIRRNFGVGNSTGLGMAPFLINHPALIHAWINARETALARVRSTPVTTTALACFLDSLQRARGHVANWQTSDVRQQDRIVGLGADLDQLAAHVDKSPPAGAKGWDQLWLWGEQALALEGQEMLLSLILDPHGDLVDDLTASMAADEELGFQIDGIRTVGELREQIAERYDWAMACDWSTKSATARLWYVSAEKLEPRLAERAEEPLEPYEQPLAPGRDMTKLYTALADFSPDATIAEFLARHAEHRHAVRRCQVTGTCDYAEIRDNTIDAEMLPIDLLRAKLSFFGATGFDPKSDRWVRITLFQGAPYPDESEAWAADDWMWRT